MSSGVQVSRKWTVNEVEDKMNNLKSGLENKLGPNFRVIISEDKNPQSALCFKVLITDDHGRVLDIFNTMLSHSGEFWWN